MITQSFPVDLDDPLRAIHKYNNAGADIGDNGSGGIYGVIKHMTDEPNRCVKIVHDFSMGILRSSLTFIFSYEEFSYGRLPPTASTTTTTTTTTTTSAAEVTQEDKWKIFPRNKGWDDHRSVRERILSTMVYTFLNHSKRNITDRN